MSTASDNPMPLEPSHFSIRAPRPLWIGVAAAGLIVAAAGLHIGWPIYRQQVAVRAIETIGGSVERRQLKPDWLRHWIGDERARLLGDVVEVRLDHIQLTDAQLAQLQLHHLPELQVLGLTDTYITDAGFQIAAALPRLRKVCLFGTIVTKSQVKDLRRRRPELEIYANGGV